MHNDHTPVAPRPIAGRTVDPHLRALTRDWFDQDLQARIDAAMDRQLALFLAGGSTPAMGSYRRAA
jgi:hypothetical protein